MISKRNAPSFTWRDVCEGWTLLDTANLHVIQERMPPATCELLHVHTHVRQLYFVLEGEAAIDFDDRTQLLRAGDALAIEPLRPHRMTNRSQQPLEFLVISSAPPRQDREDLE